MWGVFYLVCYVACISVDIFASNPSDDWNDFFNTSFSSEGLFDGLLDFGSQEDTPIRTDDTLATLATAAVVTAEFPIKNTVEDGQMAIELLKRKTDSQAKDAVFLPDTQHQQTSQFDVHPRSLLSIPVIKDGVKTTLVITMADLEVLKVQRGDAERVSLKAHIAALTDPYIYRYIYQYKKDDTWRPKMGYGCVQCNYTGRDATVIRLHFIAQHTNIRLYPCMYCDELFKGKSNRKDHEMRHEKNANGARGFAPASGPS